MVDAGLLTELCERYDITFKNPALLDEAFTHSSYANEHQNLGIHDNERLEFLGDAVLELTVSDYLYNKYPDLPEGKLTRMRAEIVQTRSFSAFAKEANFDKYIKLGRGEEKSGARQRATLLEDLFEAFNGALYLDQGKAAVVKFLSQTVFPKIDSGVFLTFMDHKTHLQEYLQQNGAVDIAYNLLDESGAANQRQFTVAVTVNGELLGQGSGSSKKSAEQAAAAQALQKLHVAD
ncbi:MAG: ribonuclease III [Candidatus Paralactobacillus gallistercoris]|uniref:Ribonuclease 3 n=1 Tax=Candidatus Paralactobacillus gallistercoris TaxID=2838724 RepID=A0A948TJQ1_9LACO|nr:ribonuclease III [Candidatus Paralactobacillus gallistercoris]